MGHVARRIPRYAPGRLSPSRYGVFSEEDSSPRYVTVIIYSVGRYFHPYATSLDPICLPLLPAFLRALRNRRHRAVRERSKKPSRLWPRWELDCSRQKYQILQFYSTFHQQSTARSSQNKCHLSTRCRCGEVLAKFNRFDPLKSLDPFIVSSSKRATIHVGASAR